MILITQKPRNRAFGVPARIFKKGGGRGMSISCHDVIGAVSPDPIDPDRIIPGWILNAETERLNLETQTPPTPLPPQTRDAIVGDASSHVASVPAHLLQRFITGLQCFSFFATYYTLTPSNVPWNTFGIDPELMSIEAILCYRTLHSSAMQRGTSAD